MYKVKYIFILLFACWITSIQWVEGYAQTSQKPKTKTTTTKTNTQKKPVPRKPAQNAKPKSSTAKPVKKPAQAKKPDASAKKSNEEINKLKDQQSEVKKEMKKIDESISQTRLTTKQTLKEIERLNDDIKRRNDLINKQNRGIAKLEAKIFTMTAETGKMETEYNLMKQRYINLVYHAYLRNNSYSRLLFILSASSFQESYRRFNYLRQFAELRKQQAIDIETSRVDLVAKKEQLSETKRLSEALLVQREKEQKLLLAEKGKQDSLVVSLQKREKELKKELEAQQKIANQLNNKIEQLIAEEARQAEARRKAEAAASTQKGQAIAKEEKVLSGGFEKNKGALPMPVKGRITGRFGSQPHPILKGITINNKGIYITATKGAEAATVYEGVVTQCFSIPGTNNAVIVRHGNYLTVYANLAAIHVKVGDKVQQGTKLGKIYEDVEDGGSTVLFFQVWKEKELLNPENWIRK